MTTQEYTDKELAKRATAAKREALRLEIVSYIRATNEERAILAAQRSKESINAHMKRVMSYEVAAQSYDMAISKLTAQYGADLGDLTYIYSKQTPDERGEYHFTLSTGEVELRVAGTPWIRREADITNYNQLFTAYNTRVAYERAKIGEDAALATRALFNYLNEASKQDEKLAALLAEYKRTH